MTYIFNKSLLKIMCKAFSKHKGGNKKFNLI